ncbi:alpha/beta fold hydrolase [Mobilicoccus pelagius]|uniref:Peptidase S33 family protein n=1 Tax=Mobilicoccus pelagius NBRC 104925 TaxID=1089455 RepID=H5UQE5_9MICO|nr:alpha/beta hydrolase [Mobilicoccus pelagius]GAB47953.1 peptidase S33 family protein [Mobilicoccus pelagius NBRC 104925]
MAPRGVPELSSGDGWDGQGSVARSAVGVGLGLAAAGLTAAAGMAADRLSRERRTAVALDAGLDDNRFHETPDAEHVVRASDGVELHVEVDEPGEGVDPDRPTVVLSHGYCLNLTSWVFQRRALRAAGYRVVLWDQRGHGSSGMGPKESISIDQLGDDLHRVVDAVVATGPVVLVGHSMGGMSMMALALEHEDFVRGRVAGAAFVATSPGDLSGVSYGFGTLGGRLIRRLTPLTSQFLAPRQTLVDTGLRQARDIVDYVVDHLSFGSPVPLSVAQLATDMIFGTRMEVIAAFFPVFDEHDKREALQAFDGVESLVISGTADRLTPPQHSEEIVRLVPGAEHILVRDAGHLIMLEHPDVVNEHLLDLLTRAGRVPTGPRPRRVRQQVSDVARTRAARRARRRKDLR